MSHAEASPTLIEVSENEISALFVKAARARGFDEQAGTWLAHSSCWIAAITIRDQRIDWAVKALEARPEPVVLVETSAGWTCKTRSSLIKCPTLLDLWYAGEPVFWGCDYSLDVPQLHPDHTHFTQYRSLPTYPLKIGPQAWDRLHALAAQTYVPASEASRKGAGSDSSDQD